MTSVSLLSAQQPALRQGVQLAGLRPLLVWQRTSPTMEKPDGPVLYQIQITLGAPNTLPRYDASGRHFINSLILDNGSNVTIGGLQIAANGTIQFANGQSFPGSVNSVSAGDNFITIGGTTTNPTVSFKTATGDARYLTLSGGTMTGNITFAAGQTFPGLVTSVTAGDGTIAIGGTASAPTVAVGTIAAGNIGNGQVVKSVNGQTDAISIAGSNGLSASAAAGTVTVTSNATAANTASTIVSRDAGGSFAATTISASSTLALPDTASSSVGVITLGGTPFLHNFGTNDTFLGLGAGNFTMTGPSHANTGLGHGVLAGLTTGGANTAIGDLALPAVTTGNSNIAIGQGAGNQLTSSETSDIYIDSQGVTGESNTTRIGTEQTAAYIAGTIHGDGSGLTGVTASGLNCPSCVTNTMLASPSVTVTAGSGLTGGGAVPLGAGTTLNLDTTFTDGRYLLLSGGVVTGPVGFGTGLNGQALVDINGTQTEVSNNEQLLKIDGTLNSSPGNSYSTGLAVYPTTTMTGYTNYNKGIDVALSSTGGQIAHSVVAVNVNQPSAVNGSECVVNFGINVPNQSAPCALGQPTRNYGFFENGVAATMNYFAHNLGIGTPTPGALLSVNGNAVIAGPVGFGASLNSQALVDINGTQTESSNNEQLLKIDGTLNSNPGNSYSTGLAVYPTTTMSGYTNYNKGIDVALSSTGGQIAHSVVAVNVNQPSAVNGSECVVSFGINVPNQSAPCSTPQPTRNYGFFENGGAGTMNYFANNVGIGTPTPGALLSVNGNAVINGPVGLGTTPNSQSLVDINGTQTESGFNEQLLLIDGTLNSNPGNSYSTGLAVYPKTTMTGYTNYNKGIDVALSSTGGQIAHSVVAVNVNQPSAVNGSDCVVSFGINVPNQSAPCSTPQPTRNYGFFENGVAGTMNYFAHNVGIGTAFPTGGTVLLSVNGDADKVGGGSWSTFSDIRLKTVRGKFSPGLAEILRLNPIRYRYKEQNPLGIRDTGEHIGFVAQDVQKVIPEAVTTNDRGYLLVNNDPILWTMLNAIKEQQAVIEKQRDQIQQQLAELEKIRSTIAEQQKRAQEQEVRLQALELKMQRPSGGETQTAKLSASHVRPPVGH
jgi:hypothetical protein